MTRSFIKVGKMGLCESTEEKKQRLQNEAIEKQLFESDRILKRTQKLLLLGKFSSFFVLDRRSERPVISSVS